MSAEVARQRVKRGIAFLLTKMSEEELRKKVDLRILSMFSCRRCLLSQAMGKNYWDAVKDLGLTRQQTIDYGFFDDPVGDAFDFNVTYTELGEAVRAEFREGFNHGDEEKG